MTECDCGTPHLTLVEFKKLSPWEQGFASYMQASHPGSELKGHDRNPYPKSTPQHERFNEGQQAAMLDAQDSEE